jgi:hypothetical protein
MPSGPNPKNILVDICSDVILDFFDGLTMADDDLSPNTKRTFYMHVPLFHLLFVHLGHGPRTISKQWHCSVVSQPLVIKLKSNTSMVETSK